MENCVIFRPIPLVHRYKPFEDHCITMITFKTRLEKRNILI